jgi:hypothetical protein
MVERVFAIRVETPPDAVNPSKKRAAREDGSKCAGEDLNLHDRNGH